MSNNGNRFHISLCGFKCIVPDTYDLIHRRRWGGELLLGAVGVQHRVVVRQEGILDLNLGGEQVRKKRESHSEKAR